MDSDSLKNGSGSPAVAISLYTFILHIAILKKLQDIGRVSLFFPIIGEKLLTMEPKQSRGQQRRHLVVGKQHWTFRIKHKAFLESSH